MAGYGVLNDSFSGAALLIKRRTETAFAARFLYTVNSIEFAGGREEENERRLALAFAEDQGTSVRSLRRVEHAEDATCWLHGDGWCLSKRDPD